MFLALMALVALTSGGQQTGLVQDRTTAPAPTPRRSPCVACGVGETCDPDTGRCILSEHTPLPCVRGARYDEEEGFCVPEATPKPTDVPSATLAPGGTARPTPRTPRTPDTGADAEAIQPTIVPASQAPSSN